MWRLEVFSKTANFWGNPSLSRDSRDDLHKGIVYFFSGEEPSGRIVIELFPKVAPRACENFSALCTGNLVIIQIARSPFSLYSFFLSPYQGEHGVGTCGSALHYLGTVFHRVVKDLIIQGGDIEGRKTDDAGGESIFGRRFGEEEVIDFRNELERAVATPLKAL